MTINVPHTQINQKIPFKHSDLIHHPDAFYDAISEVQPTVFFGTPAVYESLFYRLKELRRTMSGLQRMFLNWDETPVELFATFIPSVDCKG